MLLVRAGAEQRDGLVPRAAAERVDGGGRELLHVPAREGFPGKSLVLEGVDELPGGSEVAVPVVDLLAADAAGPEAHHEDAGSIIFVRRVVDPFGFQHLFL
jgi:hypothetical protein